MLFLYRVSDGLWLFLININIGINYSDIVSNIIIVFIIYGNMEFLVCFLVMFCWG